MLRLSLLLRECVPENLTKEHIKEEMSKEMLRLYLMSFHYDNAMQTWLIL